MYFDRNINENKDGKTFEGKNESCVPSAENPFTCYATKQVSKANEPYVTEVLFGQHFNINHLVLIPEFYTQQLNDFFFTNIEKK